MQTEKRRFAHCRHVLNVASRVLCGVLWLAGCPAGAASVAAHSSHATTPHAQPLSLLWLAEDRAANAQIVDVNDDTFHLIAEALPNLQLQTQFVSMVKSRSLLQKQANSCTGNLMPLPERQGWGLFSQLPQVVFPGLRLYVRADSPLQQLLVQQARADRVQVEAMLQTPVKFRLGYAAERSYGSALDRLFKTQSYQHKLWQRRASDTASGVLMMFSRGRIDAIVEYPNVVEHYLAQQAAKVAFVSYTIDETPNAVYGHIVCANGPQGQQLMQHIDKAMHSLVKERRYLDAHLRWFPAELHSMLTVLYDQAYGTHFSKLAIGSPANK